MSLEEHDPLPFCVNCQRTMTPRPGKGHFCPGCAEYDYNIPTIYPRSPAHPAFERLLKKDPEMAVGHGVVRHDVGDHPRHLGEVVEYDEEEEEYRVTSDLNEPFAHTEYIIGFERFMEYAYFTSPNDTGVPSNRLCLVLE